MEILRGIWIFSVICLTILGKACAQKPRIVCYYTSWSIYRNGNASFNIQNMNPNPCTHIIYAYARINDANTIEPTDTYQDLKNGGYAKFTGLKTNNTNLKTLLSIRSNDATSKFSPLVGAANQRLSFNKNAIRFLREHNFDGVDLNWQHPTYGNVSQPEDRANYAQFVQELREEFDWESSTTGQSRLLLTVTISPYADIIDQGYDVEKLNQYSDWLNIVTYNYYNASAPTTNHHAPLYEVEGEGTNLNVNFSVNYLIKAGADRQKLVIGVPTYGKSYTLSNSSENGIGVPIHGPGKPGNGTGAAGTLAYFEICQNIIGKDNWTVIDGSYAYNDDQWVSYDDYKTIRSKAQYVVKEGLGGIMFWTIDMDDFRGTCSSKPYPLIRAAKEGYTANKRIVKTGSNKNREIAKPSKMPSSEASKSPTLQNATKPELTLELSKTDFKCEDDRYFPHPTDCKKYIYCKSTELSNQRLVPHELTCTADLLFNVKKNICDYARNVNCSNLNRTGSTPTTTLIASQYITTSSSTGISTTASPIENDDSDIEDSEIIKKFTKLIKMTGSLGKLEKQLRQISGNLPTFDNTNLDKLPTTEATDSQVINVTPKLSRKRLENLSDFDDRPSQDHELQDDSEKENSNGEAMAKNEKPVKILSQNNNVSWIVLFL